ncbi:glycosyltransferase [Pseudomonas sp. NY15463]|uniref:glycosyltransferase n=1 Tax=Pseudomonas sp. NY15463 TaxID=3400361 RepID=UPI003A891360
MSVMQWGVLINGTALFSVLIFKVLLQARKVKDIPPMHPIESASYTPYSNSRSFQRRKRVTLKQVIRELTVLSRYLPHIRTYSVSGAQAWIPRIAGLLGMKVSLGVWICDDERKNSMEIARAAVILRRCNNIVRVVVGNEVLFRHDMPLRRLKEYIHEVKLLTGLPVTTAELWHIWLSHPSLADCVDEITIHILPFWEGVNLAEAVNHTVSAVDKVSSAFPGRKIYVGEVGWPSGGHALNTMPADEYQQAEYIRGVVSQFKNMGVDYNVIEAFDQRWKRSEGTVGRHWGMFKSNGKVKFALGGKTSVPVKGGHVFLYEFCRGALGRKLLLCSGLAILLALAERVWLELSPLSPAYQLVATGVWCVWCISVLLISLHETVDGYLMPRNNSLFSPLEGEGRGSYKVAIHIPCSNEPPTMVNDTLSRISELFHGDYEVHVIDNNTDHASFWEPVQAHCLALGDKFNFWRVEKISGNKGGALNFLLGKTSEDVDVIAVVDSDYQIEQDWLGLTSLFDDPEIAVLQSPQDYRDQVSLFKRLCYYEYKSFFNVGMPIRNNFNAIILHGTMTLIRARVLRALRWSEQCVCEDAELGLRILQQGHKMRYIPVSYGKGLMPDSFNDYKRQRFRWVRGAVQILMGHAKAIFRKNEQLSWAQRYQFIIGWTHWLSQAGGLLMTSALIAWSALSLLAPPGVSSYPLLISSSLVLAFVVTLLAQMVLYVRYSPDGTYNAWLSILASHALNHIVAQAVFYSLWSKSTRFVVTPKQTAGSSLGKVLSSCAGEALLLAMLIVCALLVMCSSTLTLSSVVWSVMLITRSFPYGAALFMAYLSAAAKRPETGLGSHNNILNDCDTKTSLP